MKTEAVTAGMQQVLEGGPATFPPGSVLFTKILIANRGEIACRIIKTARRMGFRTVAVYSEADEGAHHVAMADEAVFIGAGPARSSYLDMSRIIEACRQTGAEAVHPGYGFLSESPDFALKVESAGLVFIGPQHHCIAAMGDKIAAKRLAIAAGVNVVPGWNEPVASADHAVELARTIGYPLMVKASSGGGGRGLRVALDEAELVAGVAACRSEALGSFGDGTVFLERLIPRARHVEVQILADAHGNCVHLGERECSVQRRHQKLIEESPSPLLDSRIRERMCEQAVALVRSTGYQSIGTVEFLVGEDGSFFFLEMNTRLQVEHAVTECVTGLDLVEQMIRIASGERLQFSQAQILRRGWAMECRINADDPTRGFLPSAGRLIRFQPPASTMEAALPVPAQGGVRVDSGVREGDVVSTHYDSMICKIIVHAADRDQCIRMMRDALDSLVIRGVSSNQAFQAAVFAHPGFRSGRFDTGFVSENFGSRFVPAVNPAEAGFLTALAVAVHLRMRQRAAGITGQVPGLEADAGRDYVVVVAGADNSRQHTAASVARTGDVLAVVVAGVSYLLTLRGAIRDLALQGDCAGVPFRALCERVGLDYHLARNGSSLMARVMSPRAAELERAMPWRPGRTMPKALLSPMPGRLMEVSVLPGQRVRAGERLAVVEAMKMENVLLADEDVVIAGVEAGRGESLSVDQVILRFQ